MVPAAKPPSASSFKAIRGFSERFPYALIEKIELLGYRLRRVQALEFAS
jgi:hypothetical protein